MNFFALSGIFSGVAMLSLTIIVLLHDYKSRLNVAYSLFLISVSWWVLSIYFIAQATTVGEAFFWWRIAHIGVILIPITFLNFVYVFLKLPSRKAIIVSYLIGILFLIANTTPYFISNMRWVFDSFYYDSPPGPLYIPFVAFFGIIVFYGTYLLYRGYHKASGNAKGPIATVLFVYSVSFLGGSLAYLPVFGVDVHPAPGTFVIAFGAPAIFYAITRYRLFNIKLVITELTTITTWGLFLTRIIFMKDLNSVWVDALVLLTAFALGIFAIRSAIRESSQREQLQDLTEHLQQKVAAQTQEIRSAYEVEKKARIELEELDKAKDQFILTTQHHLRTPLTIVKGYVDSLLNKPPKTTLAESKDALNKTSVATSRLASLVNELLDISQMQVGKDILRREPVNPKKIVEEVLSELQPEIEKRRIETTINIPEDSTIEADPHKIKDALTNLLDNAVKYNKEGGEIKIKGEKTRHPIERDKQIYRITIEDTGIGISPEELPKLFTQYFQRGKEAEKLYTTGRGIGLAVTRNIIAAHNGRIYAESEGRGKGARFVVELPAD